ncbi:MULTISPECIES: TonB-dependent receptor [unclassified Pseudovibrio]|uniref:TonB-dependent receptor domain-containing protein n=1 Tax=unclassified Pseudovibrio TaxID=2627060 RepID=UPI0007AEAF04|nr:MULTISPECIES: TonB-dependent receptor [unclassified Pseudovibrio]KZL03356.1 TonB-dependent heme receptor A precursor [Pseudovibrio sp. W74]KZL12190.1 TonB-dependent heme receptor A precursor [Pseudovibrio sp. Ad14]
MSNSRYSRAALLASTTLSLALISAAVSAQEATQPVAADSPATMLDEIIVSAGKEKVAIDTPQAVTSVSQEQIEAAQASTLGEILDAVPGITTINADNALGQSLNIRGIGGAFASDENRMIMQIDGVTSFFEMYRAGSFFFDTELLKEVEVLRGPASSTLFGSGALGGVVSARTKDASDFLKGDDRLAVRTKAMWDSNGNGARSTITVAARPLEDLEMLLNLNYGRDGDYDGADGQELSNSRMTDLSGLAKLKYSFGADKDQSLIASYFNVEKSGYGLYDQTRYDPTFGLADQVTSEQQALLAYENTFSNNDLLDFKAQISWSQTNRELKNITVPYIIGSEAEYTYNNWQAKLENTSEFKFSDGLETYLTYGIEGQYRERLNPRLKTNGTVQPGSSSHPEGETHTLGVFGQAEFVIHDRLTLIPGMRVDHSRLKPGTGVALRKDLDETAYSPKLAAIYELTNWLNVFGSVAHTERMPVLDEVFSGDGFTDLGKEKSNNFEAGLGFKFNDVLLENDSLRFKVTGFYNNIDNYLYSSRDHATGKTITTAIDEARIKGIELEAGYSSDSWYGNLGASVTRGDNLSDDEYLDSVAADNLFLSVGYKITDYNLDVSWRSDLYAEQDRVNDADDASPGYALHSARLAWKPEDGFLAGSEVRASVTNIFDQKHTAHLSETEGKGRSFKLSLVKTF